MVEATGNGTLIITLAYMDYPAISNVMPLLVNDLDLKVISPDGWVCLFVFAWLLVLSLLCLCVMLTE